MVVGAGRVVGAGSVVGILRANVAVLATGTVVLGVVADSAGLDAQAVARSTADTAIADR